MKIATLILLTSIATPVLAHAVPDPSRQLDASESQALLDKYISDLQQLGCADSPAVSGTEHGGSTPLSESNYIAISTRDGKTIRVEASRVPGHSTLKIDCNGAP